MSIVEQDAAVRRLERIANLMDSCIPIPGTKYRLGLDSLIGLVPGVGDGVALFPSLYIVIQARDLGVPWPTLGRMLGNIGVDLLVGAVPLLGDLFDIGFKANRRNVDLIKNHLRDERTAPPPS